MSTESLKTIFLNVADEESVTHQQEDTPSHDPLEEDDKLREDEVVAFTKHDGLDDAVAGTESS